MKRRKTDSVDPGIEKLVAVFVVDVGVRSGNEIVIDGKGTANDIGHRQRTGTYEGGRYVAESCPRDYRVATIDQRQQLVCGYMLRSRQHGFGNHQTLVPRHDRRATEQQAQGLAFGNADSVSLVHNDQRR